MIIVLALLLLNAALGAFDTLWFHEYKAQLPTKLAHTRTELMLHTARDFLYTIVYGVFAWWTPSGLWVLVFGLILTAEIYITLTDFVVEDRDRPAIGGIAPGERVLHTLMAIVYGAMLANLVPILAGNAAGTTALVRHDAPTLMSLAAAVMAVGIAITGVRDLLAVLGIDVLKPVHVRA